MKINVISVISFFVAISLLLGLGFITGCNQVERRVDATSDDNYNGDRAANPYHALLTRPDTTTVDTGSAVETNSTVKKGIVNYGANVYYFPFTSDDFGNALSVFLLAHRDMEVTAMTGNVVREIGGSIRSLDSPGSSYDYGVSVGYFVTFREKK